MGPKAEDIAKARKHNNLRQCAPVVVRHFLPDPQRQIAALLRLLNQATKEDEHSVTKPNL